MASTKVDESIMNSSAPIGSDGISSLVNSVQQGTAEVKNLLSNECDVILECRICRNLFRSVPNFIAHKRSYCRASAAELFRQRFLALDEQGGQQTASKRTDRPERPSSTESCPSLPIGESSQISVIPKSSVNGSAANGDNRSSSSGVATKNNFNFLKCLSKRIEAAVAVASQNGNDTEPPIIPMHSLPNITKMVPFTTFENGVQVIKNPWILEKLNSKEGGTNGSSPDAAADDATLTMVVPQDVGHRLHNMELRTRRQAGPPIAVKEISKRDQELYERLSANVAQNCDLASLQCLLCKKSFKGLDLLAFHFTIDHIGNTTSDGSICMLCGNSYADIEAHVDSDHRATAIKYEEDTGTKKKSAMAPPTETVQLETFQHQFEDASNTNSQSNSTVQVEERASPTEQANETSPDQLQGSNGFVSSISVTATVASARSRSVNAAAKKRIHLKKISYNDSSSTTQQDDKKLPTAPMQPSPRNTKTSPQATTTTTRLGKKKSEDFDKAVSTESPAQKEQKDNVEVDQSDAKLDQEPKEDKVVVVESADVGLPAPSIGNDVSPKSQSTIRGETCISQPENPRKTRRRQKEVTVEPNKNGIGETSLVESVKTASVDVEDKSLDSISMETVDSTKIRASKRRQATKKVPTDETKEQERNKKIDDIILAVNGKETDAKPKSQESGIKRGHLRIKRKTAEEALEADNCVPETFGCSSDSGGDNDSCKDDKKEVENQDHQKSSPPSAAPNEVPVPRTMRKRTLKSPYDANEYVNSWPPQRRLGNATTKPSPQNHIESPDPIVPQQPVVVQGATFRRPRQPGSQVTKPSQKEPAAKKPRLESTTSTQAKQPGRDREPIPSSMVKGGKPIKISLLNTESSSSSSEPDQDDQQEDKSLDNVPLAAQRVTFLIRRMVALTRKSKSSSNTGQSGMTSPQGSSGCEGAKEGNE